MQREKKKELSNIAENIKLLRNKRKWTHATLSMKAGIAYHTLAKIEEGDTPDPRVHTVKKIAKVFGVSVDELVK